MALSSLAGFPSDCDICQNIWKTFARPNNKTHKIELGAVEEALATQCHPHKTLLQEVLREHVQAEHSPAQGVLSNVYISSDYIGRGAMILIKDQSIRRTSQLLLAKRENVPHHPGTGRILNTKWADVGILRQWKKQCLSTHTATCENPLKIWSKTPAYLIDVRNKCLVAGSSVSGPFVALSYTYGPNTSILTIDAITLERLQRRHALDAPEFERYLSPVIRHAIGLTSVIDERYLWADALCIPHANEKLRMEELRMMGAIYANALVTIISLDGDSQYGLPGLEGISKARQIHKPIIPFGDEKLIVRNTSDFGFRFTVELHFDRGSDYHTRGWTFQEHQMSPRKIIFRNQELHWQCQCNSWHEDIWPALNERDSNLTFTGNTFQYPVPNGFPDLPSLSRIISDFNQTQLRYDEDALPAISGLLSVLSRSFIGGFLYGIPEMFFERGLSWRIDEKALGGKGNLRRRISSERPMDERLSQEGLPSWSWIGWRGQMILNSDVDEAVQFRYERFIDTAIEETFPITQWYTSNSPSDPPENRRRIRSSWFENRDAYKDIAKPLPPGWSRHDAPATNEHGVPYLYPDGCKYMFKHAAAPDKAWYYPFPVTAIDSSTPPVTPEQTSYLFCNTWRACLRGRRGEYFWHKHAILYNSSGAKVGNLYLHHRDDLSPFPDAASEDVPGFPVELVILSKSRKYSRTGNIEKGFGFEKTDWYKVLWVEWKEDTAYRLGSGEVEAEEWEKLDAQPVDLILG